MDNYTNIKLDNQNNAQKYIPSLSINKEHYSIKEFYLISLVYL